MKPVFMFYLKKKHGQRGVAIIHNLILALNINKLKNINFINLTRRLICCSKYTRVINNTKSIHEVAR